MELLTQDFETVDQHGFWIGSVILETEKTNVNNVIFFMKVLWWTIHDIHNSKSDVGIKVILVWIMNIFNVKTIKLGRRG